MTPESLYIAAIERSHRLAFDIMEAIENGRSRIDILDIAADFLNDNDAVDDEGIALYERARTVAGEEPL